MELERRNLKRKPLSDCSNILTTTAAAVKNPKIPSSKTPLLTSKPFKSKSKFSLSTRQTEENSFTASTGSNNDDENPRILSIPSKPNKTSADFGSENPKIQTHPCTTPRLKKPSTRSDVKNPGVPVEPCTPLRLNGTSTAFQNDGFRTIYTRRRTVEKTNDKGKQVASAVPFDCPSAEKAGTRDKWAEEDRDAAQSKSCTAVRPRAAKKQRLSLPAKLPDRIMPPDPDFIASQVAYFKDVDAFELQEEVVSESELE